MRRLDADFGPSIGRAGKCASTPTGACPEVAASSMNWTYPHRKLGHAIHASFAHERVDRVLRTNA